MITDVSIIILILHFVHITLFLDFEHVQIYLHLEVNINSQTCI